MEGGSPSRPGLSLKRKDGEGSAGWRNRVSKAQRQAEAQPSGKSGLVSAAEAGIESECTQDEHALNVLFRILDFI